MCVHVARDFEGGICEEECGEAPVVFVVAHPEILLQPFDFRVANVSTCRNG